jgi:pyruvate/2-oxoglutarate dehydrogenase complex dihydrolipoamide acyltransferase (E2) component
MPQIPIIMPQLGESIAEATVVRLLVQVGDEVEADQDVFEVETNKATMTVSTPCPGRVQKVLVKVDESYVVGAVLGYLDVTPETVARMGLQTPPTPCGETESSPGVRGRQSARRGTNRPRPARAGECGRSQLHVPAHESAHGGIGPACR